MGISTMLTDDQILPVCYYWARVLSNQYYSFDELVNEAYSHAINLRSPLLLHKWVKYKMIQLIRGRRKNKDITSTLPPEQIDNAFASVEDTSFNFIEFAEMQSELMYIIDAVCTDSEKELLYFRFWLGMTYEQIGEQLGIVLNTVKFRVWKILGKLRKEYGRRAKQRI